MEHDKWIFILTNENSYHTVSPESQKITSLREMQPILKWNFLAVNPASALSPGLYIVYDKCEKFGEILKELDKSKIFILTHSNCKWTIEELGRMGFENLRKGMHELRKNNGEFYPDVSEILESGKSENEIYEKVWKTVFAVNPLEAKLEFLHLCLTPEGVEKALKQKLHEDVGLHDNLLIKLSKIAYPTSDEYIFLLTEIRDKVLADNL